jgi:hypothetical protein
VLQLGEEPLDQVALAVEPLAETRLPFAIVLGRDVGRGTLVLNHLADAVGVVGLVRQHDGTRAEMVEQSVGDLAVVRLACRQAEPDREALRVDDDVDLGREPAARSTETRIWTPLFAVAACWCARMEVLSIIWMAPSWAALMASISRSHTPAFRHLLKRL